MTSNQDIRILLVLPFFYPHRGGSQKYAEELFATLIKNYPDVTVDVLCYNTDHAQKYEEYRGFRIYRIPCLNFIPARFALPEPFSLAATLIKLSKNRYHFVNTHIRFFDPTWWLWLYAKLIGAKSIFTGHVATHPVHQNKVVETIGKLADLILAKLALKFYDYLTFTNKTAEKFFRQRLGVKKDTYLVYGGVDTSLFTPAQKDVARSIPTTNVTVPAESTLVTYVGRMIWTKGVTFLLEAAEEILTTRDDVFFVLAGPGELEAQLRKQIKENRVEDRVIMTGNLSYDQVSNLLAVSDIFINPSHHNEGFPNTVLEAGAAGCFVIATDNAGTWEVIKDGETGFLVPQKSPDVYAQKMLWAIENPTQRKHIAENFRKLLVKEFDWNVISEQFYKQILKS